MPLLAINMAWARPTVSEVWAQAGKKGHVENNLTQQREPGTSIFNTWRRFEAGRFSRSASATDLDGDGFRDLAVVHSGDGLAVMLNRGDGSFVLHDEHAVERPDGVMAADQCNFQPSLKIVPHG